MNNISKEKTVSLLDTPKENESEEKSNGYMSKHYLKLAVPAIANGITTLVALQMNIIFLSRVSSATVIAGAGLGNMTVNIMGLSLLYGLNGATDTLVSQSYGQKDLKLCGQWLNRGRAVLFVFYIPFIILLLFAENVLIAVG